MESTAATLGAKPSLALRRLPPERTTVLHHAGRPDSEFGIDLGDGLYCDLYGNLVYTEADPSPINESQLRALSQGSQTLLGPPERPAETIIERREDLVVVDPPGPENTTVITLSGDGIILNPNGGGPPAVITRSDGEIRVTAGSQIHRTGPVLAVLPTA